MQDANPKNEIKTYHFILSNISCIGCVKKIESALNKISNTQDISINLAQRTLTIKTHKSPEEIIKIINQSGYGAKLIQDDTLAVTHRKEAEQFQKKLTKAITAGVFGILLILFMQIKFIPPISVQTGQLIWFCLGFFTFIVMLITGGHIYRNAIKNLFKLHVTMDTLVAIGTGAAWVYSMIIVLWPTIVPAHSQHVFFEAAIIIIAFIDLGAALEMRARGKTSKAIERLIGLQAKTASVILDNKEIEIPIESIQIGDIIKVRPGEKIPIDGEIIEGHSTIDESMLTGEPIPILKKIHDKVIGSTINKTGSFLFKATHIGKDTVLAQIIKLVQNAQTTKPPIAKLVDRVSSIFVPSVIIISIITALGWFFTGQSAGFIFITSMTVLVIACPCALGLATPISIIIGMGKAAEYGILIRNGEALQRASKLTTIVLDKTGTITKGQPEVSALFPIKGIPENTLLQYALSLENDSEHPLAEAIIQAAKAKNIEPLAIKNFQAIAGQGISATLREKTILLGNQKLMAANNIALNTIEKKSDELEDLGHTVIFLAINQKLSGIISITDTIKTDSKAAIQRLKNRGLKVVMLTGDNQTAANKIAKQVGIEHVIANVMPQDKAQQIKNLQEKNEIIGMVGDGINDAPALAQADVGFAIGTGTDIAIESADITLIRSTIHSAADAISISTAVMRNIKQNLFGAFIYNSLGIPIAAGILYPFIGLLLNPMIAGAAMALSSVTVVSNANRLRFFKV